MDPTGTGEYRLARNPDEKDALIHVPGAGATFAELAGLAQRSDRITNLGGFGRVNYVRAQDSPFEVMIGTTKVIPNLTGTFHRNQPVGVYLQVYNAAIDQTTLRPAADAEYILLRNGKEIAKHTEDWRQINDAGPRLTLSRLIDSRTLEPGEYQIQVRIRDHVYGETIAPSAKFTVVP